MKRIEADKILRQIDASSLSEDAKFILMQFLRPIRCSCGHSLVNNKGEISCIDLPETREPLEREINESGIAIATIRTEVVERPSGLMRYFVSVKFR